ncbi:hypothetical protein DL240_02790 [Lujinxingia litoralis]|uniref:Alginate export domain-containing protein n=1 Tax=Lujinxingia litoralis TaxID=2211119 RepID=A0A328CBC6_9DELT|nr:hypothetical protein [Lujinxingia litoralis]RAL25154.1 hypothetical protein DL240_02790 [Lujinxingia litoralis]
MRMRYVHAVLMTLLTALWSIDARARGADAPRSDSSLRPTLLGEVDYRIYPAVEEGLSGFALARLRPGLVLEPVGWFRGVTRIEFAGKNPVILDAYARVSPQPWLDLNVGYSKPPLFASFVHEPTESLLFPDRGSVVSSFRVRRDLGVDIHFHPASMPVEGWVRVGNGNGSALGNDNALPAGYAALDLVFGRAHVARQGAKDKRTGLRVGAAALYERTEDREGIAGTTPMGFRYYRPVIVSGGRALVEAHLVGYLGPLRLSVEGAMAREDRSRDTDGNPSTPRVELPAIMSQGLSTELTWTLVGPLREVGSAPLPDVFFPGAEGSLEVAARYDGMWLGKGADDVEPGGSHGGAFALKWWPTNFLAASLAGYVTRYHAAAIERPDALWSWGGVLRTSFFWGS